MLRFQSRQILVLVGALALVSLLAAAAALGNCEGEEKISWALTPPAGSTVTFSGGVGTNKTVLIDNTGGGTITGGTQVLSNAKFEFVKSCAGKNILPGASCTNEFKCLEKGEAFFTASIVGGGSAFVTLKCD